VVVGHGLKSYFLNAVRSIRATAPDDHLLIIDNASPSEELKSALAEIADSDDATELRFRTFNDVSSNGKVGSLYAAYRDAFEYAISHNFELLHLIQGDMQTLWWDAEVLQRSMELYDSHPQCVNIRTMLVSRDTLLTDDLVESTTKGVMKLRNYGLIDTGLYHLGRWRSHQLGFGKYELDHGRRYLDAGFEVLCLPWAMDAPIPWPAVIRRGLQRGREVRTTKPYLLRPLSSDDVARLKTAPGQTWLEDVCIPWGWICLTPMWLTSLDSMDYWVMRYRDARLNGASHLLPRLELRGAGNPRSWILIPFRFRPPLFRLLVTAPVGELRRRLR